MEIWKDIVGYEGLYQISNLGNVKSLAKCYVCGNHNSVRVNDEKILKPNNALGYLQVGLQKNSVRTIFKVHRLVANAFIENPFEKPFVNHINGVKTDNTVSNLEWCTSKENTLHSYKIGLQVAPKGSDSHLFGKKGILNIRTKIILNTITGIYYYGLEEAAKAHGFNKGSLKCWLNGSAKNRTNLIYV